MGLLNGGIAAIFDKAFSGLYQSATLHRRARIEQDDGGVEIVETDYACRVQIDAVTEAMRQAPGYTDTDQRILILRNGLAVAPTTDDAITARGQLWGIESVNTDPANSYWELRGSSA